MKKVKKNFADSKKSIIFASAFGGIAQLARAPALQAGGRRFDSDYLHNKRPDQSIRSFLLYGILCFSCVQHKGIFLTLGALTLITGNSHDYISDFHLPVGGRLFPLWTICGMLCRRRSFSKDSGI